jgi:hypothetical protein
MSSTRKLCHAFCMSSLSNLKTASCRKSVVVWGRETDVYFDIQKTVGFLMQICADSSIKIVTYHSRRI